MSNSNELTAQARERVGKGAARELRRNNMVPAVIYGDKKPPLSIALPAKEVTMKIHAGGFMTNILSIDVDGTVHQALPKDYQLHPVSDRVIHVDLLRVSDKTIVTVEVPVHFINDETCPGIKVGGVLNVVRHTVEVTCPATDIPEAFVIDLSTLELGDSANISMVDLPNGVEPTITDRDFTIATIAIPAGLRSDGTEEEDGEDVVIETEITGQKSEGEEEDETKD
ncbi:MAG: 50S ribosomal protein L25/general stress protein Ctc [Hyphomicrobiales bacterium]|nr:50S ribosomal protein L25/general stress protein Ctc [Ahrensia sp. AH-315-G08]PCH46779.1 MAG: 50S ribosomal protein L25/general stress protein Ctc [Hyphomicrobiales bacterium]